MSRRQKSKQQQWKQTSKSENLTKTSLFLNQLMMTAYYQKS